jgi:hypothetical protein
MKIWENRKALMVTMHGKEAVIAPILKGEFGIHCSVAEHFNTDALGTFSGEIKREGSPLDALRAKCQMAIEDGWDDLIIASEGSFGPHPQLYFAHADDEWILLKDVGNNLEILGRKVSASTNFDAKWVVSWPELKAFADQVKFPSHGLILRLGEFDFQMVTKGIQDWSELKRCFNSLVGIKGSVYAETDMRAHLNPTRMGIIKEAALDMVGRMRSVCPICEFPGFGVVNVLKGLPCESCAAPTQSTLKHIMQCQRCDAIIEVMYPYQKEVESAMFCDFCNP